MNSLARGIAVLQAFSDTTTGVKMSNISISTGLSRAVVRRCLYTLEQLGYVRHGADGYYLEPKILSLSQTFFSSSSLTSQAQEFLDRVKESTGESCSLAVLDKDEVVYVARSAAWKIMTVSLGIGSRLPAFYTSLGRVLLATLPESQLDQYLKQLKLEPFTESTLTSKSDLRTAIQKADQQGYALVNEELEIGLRSLAVPVMNHDKQVVAAINVGVQATRMGSRKMIKEILPILKNAAYDLGSQLIC